MDFFLVAQDMVLGHHAKFQLVTGTHFFQLKAISTRLNQFISNLYSGITIPFLLLIK